MARRAALVLLCALVAPAAAAAPAAGRPAVRISGVYFDGLLKGEPEPDSAIRLGSTDPRRATSIAGFVLVERPRGGDGRADVDLDSDDGARRGRKGKGRGGRVRFPDGASIPPGGEVWVAASARGFVEVFGFRPDFEAEDTDPDVPNVEGAFPLLPAKQGMLALHDAIGEPVDFVAYDVNNPPVLVEADLPQVGWKGPPVALFKSSQYGWQGQVLARDRDEAGRLLDDTDTAADWDSGFSRGRKLGLEPTHRIELAGQSRFVAKRLRLPATVTACSAPDNNHAVLVDAIRGAKKSLRVSVYQITNPKIVDEIVKARLRGVDVVLWLEGSPVGGLPDEERILVDRAAKAGVQVYFLGNPPGSAIKPRYRFDHSKYVIVDDRVSIIGTENFGQTGVPAHPTYGNRGWMVVVESEAFAKELRAVWDHDFRPGRPDVISIDASPNDAFGLPLRDPTAQVDDTIQRGLYAEPFAPVTAKGPVDLELVLSPDTSLNESSAILGLIRRAKKTLYVEQNSVRRKWGFQEDDPEVAPNLALAAVVEAARRGVQVRVLLDSTWYNVQGDEDRDNDDTVMWLNDLAETEGLDIAAKVVNLETAHLQKIHAKGVIVDGREVFVGSINWSENSFKGNRELGVIVGDPAIAGYYERLFLRDWAESRIYQAPVDKSGVVTAAPQGGKTLQKVAKGDRLFVVGEVGRGVRRRVEVRVGRGKTGFIDPALLGTPEATPGEALHLIGRYAVVVGRVAATNVSERRIQLRFADEKRPPFTAVIFARNEKRFADKGLQPASAFQGRELRVRGRIQAYKGPEILLDAPDQVEIVR